MTILNTEFNIISSEKVKGTTVYSPSEEKLGSIESLMIDRISGHVRYVVLEFGGFLGIGTDRYPLPWDTLKYNPSVGGYVISLTKDQLEKAPRYDRGTTPDYTDDYGRRVHDYYGLPYM